MYVIYLYEQLTVNLQVETFSSFPYMRRPSSKNNKMTNKLAIGKFPFFTSESIQRERERERERESAWNSKHLFIIKACDLHCIASSLQNMLHPFS